MGNRTTISRAGFVAATAVMSVAVPAVVYAAPMPASQVVTADEFHAYRLASAWMTLHEKLEGWADLSEDWDTEGAVPPSDSVIDDAADFLRLVEAQAGPLPMASLAADGEVAFEWTKGTGFASVSFTDDGFVIAYLREDDIAPALRIDEPAAIGPLQPFFERINAFA